MVLPLVVFGLVCGFGTALSRPWVEYADIPSPSHGEIVFYADIATFLGDDGQNVEEIYCVVSNDQIKFIETDGSYRGNLRYTVRILDPDGNVAGETMTTVEVAAASLDDTQDRSVVQVLQSEVRLPPGTYTARVMLEDMNVIERSILSYLLKRYRKGEVEAQIESRAFEKGKVSISDIEFARSLRRTSEGAFQKSGFEVIPNAQRRYGLLLTELPVFFEVYDLRGNGGGGDLLATYRIVNRRGAEIFTSEEPISALGTRFGSTALFDIVALNAGSYLLTLTISGSDGEVLTRSERRFDIVWSPLSWGRYEFETIGDMEFILTEEEMAAFKDLSTGEQEEFLRDFWLGIDPTPGTAVNEALEEHYRRVRFADLQFGGPTRGALTDRGRLYIKYGPPDDIQSHYSDQSLVDDRTFMEGGETPALTDPFSRVGLKTGSPAAGSWDRAGSDADDVHSDQRGGSTVHGKAFEVWIYDGAGQPVRRLADRVPRSAKMRFILVDERGIGEYRLIYSTEKQEY